jgi:hypothetical protein
MSSVSSRRSRSPAALPPGRGPATIVAAIGLVALSTAAATPGARADDHALAAASFDAGRVTIDEGRTTAIIASPPLGAALERAVDSEAYALAVASDRDERWGEAAGLYQQAIAEWTARLRSDPAPAIERAIFKADRERQHSQLLAGVQAQRDKLPLATLRALALERGRIYRTKLMSVRAYTGTVPLSLFARTRHELEEALRLADVSKPGAETEPRLLLCATRAAGGDRAAARLELAHVASAEREDPAATLPLAICQAALGDLPAALALLETHVRRQPIEQRLDPFALRELYLANDWDRLRGDRRFESLFSRLRRY